MVPDEVMAFGQEAAKRLGSLMGDGFVGAYFIGSVALGGYVPNESDIDIVAVSGPRLNAHQKGEIVAALSHPNLPCPTRGFEFVLYQSSQVAAPSGTAAFEINLNTGPRMTTHVGFDASQEPEFWFVIDRAIAHHHGVTIDGPSPRDVFAPVPRPALLASLRQSTAWHRAHETLGFHTVLNACRAWRYADEDVLSSKVAAAQWALARWDDRLTIEAALRRRRGQPAPLVDDRITALLDHVEMVLEQRAGDEG